jgi:mRNA-degrading endonuclease RelE of RelBE toxin-antitoxin system
MSYNVEFTDYFARQLKRLVKKYPSLKNEITRLIKLLETNPEQGNTIRQTML